MHLALFITAAPDQETAYQAWRFAQAALAGGHPISRVFFAGAAVAHGNALMTPARNEVSLTTRWQELQAASMMWQAQPMELILCVAAALRRGILDDDNALRWEQPVSNLAAGFAISGLGQLSEAQLSADRLISFPA